MTKWLVEDWRNSYKWLSMWVAGAGGVWVTLTEDAQRDILTAIGVPAESLPGYMALAFVIARLVRQR